jgi:ketosteroid isomerase-like protein
MSDPGALTVARAYHRAWSTQDLDGIGRYLAEDLHVEVPINSYSGKRDFLEAVRRTAQMTSSVKLLAEFGSGKEALLLYDMTLPIGELRVAEHFTIAEGQIHRVRQIHDTAALRAAGFGRE